MIPGYLTRHTENIAFDQRSNNPPIVTGYLDTITNHVASLTAYDKPDIFLRGEADKDAYLALEAAPDSNMDGFVVRFKDPKSGRDAVGSISPRSSQPLPISSEGGKIGVNVSGNTLVDLGLYGGNTFLPVVLGSTSFGEASTSSIYSQDQINLLAEAGAASSVSQTSKDPTSDILNEDHDVDFVERVKKATGQKKKPSAKPNLESDIFTKEAIEKKLATLKGITMNDVIPATGAPLPKTTIETKNVLSRNANTATYNKQVLPSYRVRHD